MKKNEKVKEPASFISPTGQECINYNVYYLKPVEKLIFSVVGFVAGALVGYLFYGGIGKDAYGEPTTVTYICNTVIMCIIGIAAAKVFCNVMQKKLLKGRKNKLHIQFIDLLDSMSASLASGQNVPSAFQTAEKDLSIQYPDDAFIVREVRQINDGIRNNIEIEKMLINLGERSGIKDISNFGKVFETAYRKGGNIKEIVRNTHEILSTKTQIELEIATKVASTKNEEYIMLVMPVLIVGMIKSMGGDFADKFTSPSGLIYTTIGVVLFVVSYFIGRVILDIEV